MAMYELTDKRILDIIEFERVLTASASASTSASTSATLPALTTATLPALSTATLPALTTEILPALTAPIPVEIAMVRRISTSYQQQQMKTSIYSKYGDGDGDGDGDDVDTTFVGPAHNIITNIVSASTATTASTASTAASTATSASTAGSKSGFFPPCAKNTTTSNNQLFWCFYIAHAGMFAYETMSNAFVAENAFKYATIDHVRANASRIKSQFKRYKLSVPNFEAELISTKFLSLQMLIGLALCYDRNILYIDNRKYFEIVATDDTDPFTVIEKVKNRYCVHCNGVGNNSVGEKMRNMCRSAFWKMESITSPLKSVSHYKLAELQDIYARLDIKQTTPAPSSHHQPPPRKNLTKPELYAAIVQNI